MAEKLPYFPFYPETFLSSGTVALMSPECVGAYILLLCMAWHQDPPATLPADDSTLARWSRMAPDRWEACKSVILRAFVPCGPDRVSQPRLRAEYDKAVRTHRQNREKGRKGAAARYGKSLEHTSAIAGLQPGHSSKNQNQNQNQKEPKPSPPTPSAEPEPKALPAPNVGSVSGFGSSHPAMRSQIPAGIARQIVDAHPNRAGGGKAIAATQDALRRIAGGLDPGWPSGTPPPKDAAEWLLGRVLAYAKSGDARAGFGVGIVRWMEDAMYLDDEAAWNRPRAGAGDEDAKRVKLEKMLEALQ